MSQTGWKEAREAHRPHSAQSLRRNLPQAQAIPAKTGSVQEPPRRHAGPRPGAITRGNEKNIAYNRRS